MTDRAALRDRLVEIREHLLDQLDARIEGGHFTLLAGVTAAIAAIDAGDAETACPAAAEPMTRAIVTDIPGHIILTLYAEDGHAAAVELEAVQALVLAEQLVAASLRRLR